MRLVVHLLELQEVKNCCRINPSGKCCNTLGGNFLTGLKFSDDNFTGGDSQARIGGWFGKWLQRIGLKSYTEATVIDDYDSNP